ncbi:hypothetical protein DNK10_22150 [Pseudomonas daroniae]|nr:hypothetical protein DNK10_22150 [Pseudomonas daroniae]
MAFPFQVLQRRMARFPAQPEGPGPFCRDAAFLAGSFSQLNFAARALPRGKTGSGAVVLKRQQTLGVTFTAICGKVARFIAYNAAGQRMPDVLKEGVHSRWISPANIVCACPG